jgi:hypothetical protein
MLCVVQALNPSFNEIFYLEIESEENYAQGREQPEQQGTLKGGSQTYRVTFFQEKSKQEESKEGAIKALSTFLKEGKSDSSKSPTPMHLASSLAYSSAARTSTAKIQNMPVVQMGTKGNISKGNLALPQRQNVEKTEREVFFKVFQQQGQPVKIPPLSSAKECVKGVVKPQIAGRPSSPTERREKGSPCLAERRWSSEETRKWWEIRYHQKKERQPDQRKDQQNQEQQNQEQQNQEQQHEQERSEASLQKIKRGGGFAASTTSTQRITPLSKPALTPPQVGVFALYYILTKIGIQSDGASSVACKQEIEIVNAETTEVHKKRLEELKEAMRKEQESTRWGVASKVFSWIGSMVSILGGIVLIATGVGAVAGAMLVIGGVIQVSNQIMELSGGWNKVIDLLPGEDREKKAAVVAWMQIGVAVLCVILSGVGVIWGGYANFGEATQLVMGVMGGIATMGSAVTTTGMGVSAFLFKNKLSGVAHSDLRLAELKFLRQDLMDKMDWGINRLEKFFEELSKTLEFEEELFYADQMVNRR